MCRWTVCGLVADVCLTACKCCRVVCLCARMLCSILPLTYVTVLSGDDMREKGAVQGRRCCDSGGQRAELHSSAVLVRSHRDELQQYTHTFPVPRAGMHHSKAPPSAVLPVVPERLPRSSITCTTGSTSSDCQQCPFVASREHLDSCQGLAMLLRLYVINIVQNTGDASVVA